MFDFDAGKLVVIGVVALVVIGPKELPRVLRQVGQTIGKLRRMAAEFQGQFMEAMREAELADVKAEMEKVAESARIDVAFDPARDMRDQIVGAVEGPSAPAATILAPGAEGVTADLSALETQPSPVAGGLLEAGEPAREIAPKPLETPEPARAAPSAAPTETHPA